MRRTWVVAVEYAGRDIEPDRPAARRPLLEHAYDLHTGTLAHGGAPVRVAFPHPSRGWPVTPRRARCAACTVAVSALVADVVADVVGRTVADLTRWAARFAELVDDEWRP